jgi:hypothetical protein
MVEAIPLDGGRTFVHLAYSYAYERGGVCDTDLSQHVGANKVGFTIVDKRPDGQPVYVGKMRGVLERNTMRYYLRSTPARALRAVADQFESNPHGSGTERYAQLHELDEREYIEMKRSEYRRQQEPR